MNDSALGQYDEKNVELGVHGVVVGHGLTSLVVRFAENRVVKVPRTFTVESFPGQDVKYVECLNDINRETLKHEKAIYRRLGANEGIIPYFDTHERIELAFAEHGDLENFIQNSIELRQSAKANWILALIDVLLHVHDQKVLVDEIALRNILVTQGTLKFSDFGQGYLLPTDTDMDTVCENDLTQN